MEDLNIRFSVLWIATMLCYLLGDVMRIFYGNLTPGEIDGNPVGEMMWLGIAAIMVIPIIMVVLSVMLKHPVISWLNISVAIIFLVFNLAGIAGYEAFDIFLLSVSFVFNALIIYIAGNKLVRDFKLKKSMKS
ncbi:MAG: hypothetical protein KGD64_13410 [Candidatus Heimdallarchaeota archaeon]|nr:hypothetical protein [Candidatus Heimdallarchaeota archaeon]